VNRLPKQTAPSFDTRSFTGPEPIGIRSLLLLSVPFLVLFTSALIFGLLLLARLLFMPHGRLLVLLRLLLQARLLSLRPALRAGALLLRLLFVPHGGLLVLLRLLPARLLSLRPVLRAGALLLRLLFVPHGRLLLSRGKCLRRTTRIASFVA
jgi:hypothetical protein